MNKVVCPQWSVSLWGKKTHRVVDMRSAGVSIPWWATEAVCSTGSERRAADSCHWKFSQHLLLFHMFNISHVLVNIVFVRKTGKGSEKETEKQKIYHCFKSFLCFLFFFLLRMCLAAASKCPKLYLNWQSGGHDYSPAPVADCQPSRGTWWLLVCRRLAGSGNAETRPRLLCASPQAAVPS